MVGFGGKAPENPAIRNRRQQELPPFAFIGQNGYATLPRTYITPATTSRIAKMKATPIMTT